MVNRFIGVIVFVLTFVFTFTPLVLTLYVVKPWSNPFYVETNPIVRTDPFATITITFIAKMVLSFVLDVVFFDLVPARIGGVYVMVASLYDTINDVLNLLFPGSGILYPVVLLMGVVFLVGSLVILLWYYWDRMERWERIVSLWYGFVGFFILYNIVSVR